jgi:phosphoserine phosphatase RsbU/P
LVEERPVTAVDAQWQEVLVDLLARSHLLTGDRIAAALDELLTPVGLRPELFFVDQEQVELRPLRPGSGVPVRVENTLPGRAYQLGTVLSGHDTEGRPVAWVPLVDGVERLGLLRAGLPSDEEATDPIVRERCIVVSNVVAHVLMSKLQQSDLLATTRRKQPMSVASELLWQLLPPRTVGTESIALAAVLEPAYGVGGDAFDYAVSASEAYFAIFDSSGHDLNAGLTASVTLAASRTARREGLGLAGVAERIDAALIEQFPDYRFATGVLAHLDLDAGKLRYLIAGHPSPVLVRSGRAIRQLAGSRRMPFGRVASLAPQDSEPVEEDLEPGDLLLLHSDGVVEARDAEGNEFGTERLVELAERAAAAGLPAPETLRRLAHAARAHRGAELRDDATLVLVEWSGCAAARLVPQPRQHEDGSGDDRAG